MRGVPRRVPFGLSSGTPQRSVRDGAGQLADSATALALSEVDSRPLLGVHGAFQAGVLVHFLDVPVLQFADALGVFLHDLRLELT